MRGDNILHGAADRIILIHFILSGLSLSINSRLNPEQTLLKLSEKNQVYTYSLQAMIKVCTIKFFQKSRFLYEIFY